MKKFSLFIAFAMLAALTMVSCNNKPQEPTQEEIQAQKQALADSVLAEIDAIADEYFIVSENCFQTKGFELTEKEKQIKPDYLLDPAEASKFVTKSQKVNAMAVYLQELAVREIYGMPTQETKEVITKLAAEVNFRFDIDKYDANVPLSERIKANYEYCKENGDLASFWQFEYANIFEINYIIAQNSALFFSKISEEQWKFFCQSKAAGISAIKELAKYDEEMASLLEFRNKYTPFSSDEEREKIDSSIESAKQFREANKDKYIALRNAMLQ